MNFIGKHQVLAGIYPDSTLWNTGSPNYSPAVNMGKYGHATFVVTQGVGATGSATITMEACTTAAGGSPTAIPFSYRLCTTTDTWGAIVTVANTGVVFGAASNQMLVVEVEAVELTAVQPTKPYLRLKATVSDATAVDAGCIIVLSEASYQQDVPVTAIT